MIERGISSELTPDGKDNSINTITMCLYYLENSALQDRLEDVANIIRETINRIEIWRKTEKPVIRHLFDSRLYKAVEYLHELQELEPDIKTKFIKAIEDIKDIFSEKTAEEARLLDGYAQYNPINPPKISFSSN